MKLHFIQWKSVALALFLIAVFGLASALPASACESCAWDEECLPTWTGMTVCTEKIIVVQGYEFHFCSTTGALCSVGGWPGHRPPV